MEIKYVMMMMNLLVTDPRDIVVGTVLVLPNSWRTKFVDFGLKIFSPWPQMLWHQVHWETVTTVPGKPGVLVDFCERGKLTEFVQNSVQPQWKFLTNKIVSFWSNICITEQGLWLQTNKVSWILDLVTVRWWPVILLELMLNDPWHSTFTFCCHNLWKSIVYGSGKACGDVKIVFL